MSPTDATSDSTRGRFITFEGGEGSGKSTQIKKLAGRLENSGLRTIVTREPGGSPGAEIIRHLLLSGMGRLLGADAETLLFAAARDDHVHAVIEPALGQGNWVLCDRFYDSTRAYQGRLGKVEPSVLNALQRVTIGGLKPDRFEAEDRKFHEGLREAYRQIAAAEPQRCVLIDANAPVGTVAAKVWTAVRKRLLGADVSRVANLA
jgi:dTMP kinase